MRYASSWLRGRLAGRSLPMGAQIELLLQDAQHVGGDEAGRSRADAGCLTPRCKMSAGRHLPLLGPRQHQVQWQIVDAAAEGIAAVRERSESHRRCQLH